MLSIKQLAKATGKSESRIKQLCRKIEKAGHAESPRQWSFHESAIDFVKNLPDGRGKMTVKDRIYNDLVKDGVNHPQVWKGYSPNTHEMGWHFREFGSSCDIFVGKSWKEYREIHTQIKE